MGIDYSFLHKVLKDPTRRDILLHLSSGQLTYMELMNLSKISNTGRFNYHLKALGDLIEKTDTGKYRLTERGRLAVQLLETFPKKPSKVSQPVEGEATAAMGVSGETAKKRIDLPKKHLAVAILVLIIGISLIVVVPIIRVTAEKPSVQWQQFLPGISGTSVIQTPDGGYLALGINASVQDSEPDVFVNQEPILIKTDYSGNVVWTKTYKAENGTLNLSRIIQTDDGYILGGINVVENVYLNAQNQISLIKIDSQGGVQWSKLLTAYNSTFLDTVGPNSIASLIQTPNEEYVVITGYLHTLYISETWFVKTDSEGNLLLNKTISGASSPISTVMASDGGFAIISEFLGRGGGSRFGLVKIDPNGNTEWVNTYIQQDSVSSYAACGIATHDGGYILGGDTILDNPEQRNAGWIVRTDSEGNALLNMIHTYNGYSSSVQSIAETVDGEFMFVGRATTSGGEFNPSTRVFTWIAKIDSFGNKQGEIGIPMGNYLTSPTSLIRTEEGGFVFVGTWNESFQATNEQSFWLVKIIDFQSIPSVIWLSIQLVIVASIGIVEAVITIAVWKRVQKASVTEENGALR